MPGRRLVRKSTDSSDQTDLGDGASLGDHPDTSSTSVSHESHTKRRKINGDNGYVSSPSPAPSLPAFRTKSNALPQRSSLANGYFDESDESDEESEEDTFQPGAIKKVRLTNFVTYTSAEFNLGPSLNMVIGPNGTGKSTLVCALCLGLGFDAKLMGRAKEPGDFVKNGSHEAIIEIELQGHSTAETDLTITRRILKEGSRTEFRINGKKATNKAVLHEARKYSIQIDNLCQFLPQDRVAEFAALSPTELLAATQQAAGREEMKDWQEQLKALGKEEKKNMLEQSSGSDQLKGLAARQAVTLRDVERYQERQAIQKKVEMLELIRPFPKYRIAREQHRAAQAKRKEASLALKQLEDEVQPSLSALKKKDQYLSAIRKAIQNRDRAYEQAKKEGAELRKTMQKLDGKREEVEQKRNSERRLIREGQGDVRSADGRISNIRQQMAEPPVHFDLQEFHDQRRSLQASMTELSDRVTALQSSQREWTEQGRDADRKATVARNKLSRMQGTQGKQLIKLAKISADTAKAWDWIQQHQNEFEKPIFGPPVVECAITDPRYVDAVESLFGKGDLCAITVQTRGDFKKLQNILSNQERLLDIHLRTNERGLHQFQSPVSDEERQALGFDGWALNFITGPEPVLAMLCTDIRLHTTAVSLRDIDDSRYREIESSRVSSWITGRTSYTITRRREYGPSATSTRTRAVRQGQVWTDAPVDNSGMADLRHELDGWESQIKTIAQKNEEAQSQIRPLRDELVQLEKAVGDLNREKALKQKEAQKHATLPDRLQAEESKKEQAKQRIKAGLANYEDFTDEDNKLNFQRAQIAIDCANSTKNIAVLFEANLEAFLVRLEAESDVEFLKAKSKDVREQIDIRKREMQEAVTEATRLREVGQKLADVCTKLQDDSPGDELADFIRAELTDDLTPDQLEAMIEQEHARLQLIHGGNPHAIKEFEKRQERIDQLETNLAERGSELVALAKEIAFLRAKWEPALDALIGQISHAFGQSFAKIGCAGEVTIKKTDDFSEWAVEIMVKFRYVPPSPVPHPPLGIIR